MRCIKLRAEANPEELKGYFTRKAVPVDQDQKERCLLCYMGKKGISLDSFCEILSDYIWTHRMKVFLNLYMNKKHHLTCEEACQAAEKALSVAMSIKEGCDVIKEALLEYFTPGSRFLDVEGFVRFRLQDLQQDLMALADLCGDELVAKREYEEFISLLRSFVDLQKPTGTEAHLFVESGGKHRLLDGEGCDLLAQEEISSHISMDDLILSSLVSVAPGKIYLYNEKNSANPQLLDTIKSIFPGRVLSVSVSPSPALPGFGQ